ncbi:hypothetical protein [Paenibacillus polymyxa]|uniref:Uncharacterized protein n=1 Tax=Paenibacillus polymyxa (strain SC2) TaxID=886882 RepID=E3EKU1_PAEPS|nr:hypothetical protein [Paenibacillus polymyxa]ADO59542.1 hypothetical protein PPSC2_27380 [Paenibacillus polymyxa SC2]WPQ59625.1 hypothetical protein SKN87_28605 [Paenibacillus polymyxa]
MNEWVSRAKFAMTGEDGASNVEIIVWISVVLVIATALWLFRDAIVNFISKAKNAVDAFRVS